MAYLSAMGARCSLECLHNDQDSPNKSEVDACMRYTQPAADTSLPRVRSMSGLACLLDTKSLFCLSLIYMYLEWCVYIAMHLIHTPNTTIHT